MDSLGMVAAIGGPILALVLLFAMIANKRRSNAQRAQTERATHDLYQTIDKQDKATDPNP